MNAKTPILEVVNERLERGEPTINERWLEWFGLWIGDGWKTKRFGISNTKLDIMKYFLEGCRKYMGLNPKESRINVRVPLKDWRSIESITQNALNILGLTEDNLSGVSTYWRAKRTCYYLYWNEEGLTNLLVTELTYVHRLIKNNPKAAEATLRGLAATDGFVITPIGRTRYMCGISVKKPDNRELIHDALDVMGIRYRDSHDAVWIEGIRWLQRVRKHKLFDLHPSRRERLEKILNGVRKPHMVMPGERWKIISEFLSKMVVAGTSEIMESCSDYNNYRVMGRLLRHYRRRELLHSIRIGYRNILGWYLPSISKEKLREPLANFKERYLKEEGVVK